VQPTKYRVGDLELDPNQRTVRVGQKKPLTLSRLQYKFLDYLAINAGHVLTIEAIIDGVWGPHGADNDTVRQLVHRLRSKIEPDPDQPRYIATVPGLGYGLMITPPQD
jgi:DNA-binding response OmpR family regulator